MDAQRSKIITQVYTEWAREQVDSFTPNPAWAGANPSQFPEHAELLSVGEDAENDLFERTTKALEEAGLRGKMPS